MNDLLRLLWPAPHRLLGLALGEPLAESRLPTWPDQNLGPTGGWARCEVDGVELGLSVSTTLGRISHLEVTLTWPDGVAKKHLPQLTRQLDDLLGAHTDDAGRATWPLTGTTPSLLQLAPDYESKHNLFLSVSLAPGGVLRAPVDFIDLQRLSTLLATERYPAAHVKEVLSQFFGQEKVEATSDDDRAAVRAIATEARTRAADERALAVAVLGFLRFDDLKPNNWVPAFRSVHAEFVFRAFFDGWWQNGAHHPGWLRLDCTMVFALLDVIATSPEERPACAELLVRALEWAEPTARTTLEERITAVLENKPAETWSVLWPHALPGCNEWLFDVLTRGLSDEAKLLYPTRLTGIQPDAKGAAEATCRWFAQHRGFASNPTDVPWVEYLKLLEARAPAAFDALFTTVFEKCSKGHEQRRLCDALATASTNSAGASVWRIGQQQVTITTKHRATRKTLAPKKRAAKR